jgi:hypothetical protein
MLAKCGHVTIPGRRLNEFAWTNAGIQQEQAQRGPEGSLFSKQESSPAGV